MDEEAYLFTDSQSGKICIMYIKTEVSTETDACEWWAATIVRWHKIFENLRQDVTSNTIIARQVKMVLAVKI